MEFNFKNYQSKSKLNSLESVAVKCVLSKTADKLSIISQLLNRNFPVTRNPRFKQSQQVSGVVRFVPPEYKIPNRQLELKSIQKTLQTLVSVLSNTDRGFESGCAVNKLEYFLLRENLTRFNEYEVKQQNIDGKEIITTLNETITKYKAKSEKMQNFLKLTEPCLEAAITTAHVCQETAERRCQAEQDTREEQNILKLKTAEYGVKQNIYDTDSECKKEERIHSEIHDMLNVLILELKTKLDRWNKRYTDEIDKLDMNILQMQSKIEEHKTMMENLQEMVLCKNEEIAELDQEINKLEENRRLSMAVRVIEQWWKHVMLKRKQKQSMKLKSSTVKVTKLQKGKKGKNKQ